MSETIRRALSSSRGAAVVCLGVALLLVVAAVPAAAQVAQRGDCLPAARPDAAPSPTIASMVIPLMEEPAYTSKGEVGDGVNAQYCYWRWLADCGSCFYHFSCWLWYGSANENGKECIGRQVEYCDGHPTGNEVPVYELQCGCTP